MKGGLRVLARRSLDYLTALRATQSLGWPLFLNGGPCLAQFTSSDGRRPTLALASTVGPTRRAKTARLVKGFLTSDDNPARLLTGRTEFLGEDKTPTRKDDQHAIKSSPGIKSIRTTESGVKANIATPTTTSSARLLFFLPPSLVPLFLPV